MRHLLRIILLVTFASCSSASSEDFKEEGQGIVRSLVQELRGIKTKQDLVNGGPLLREHFRRLAEVMVAAKKWAAAHNEAIPLLQEHDHYLSGQLREELQRIYRLPDGRELIEQYQEGALSALKE